MNHWRWTALPACIALLCGCAQSNSAPPSEADAQRLAGEAKAMVQRINDEAFVRQRESSAAGWVAATYINDDTQLLAARAQQRDLAYQAKVLDEARRYTDARLDNSTQRSLDRLLNQTVLPPASAAEQAELTTIGARLEAAYGSAKSCPDPDKPESCRDLIELSRVLAESRDPAALRQAWIDWHDTAAVMRDDYRRYAELMNHGAREYGYKDTGDPGAAATTCRPRISRSKPSACGARCSRCTPHCNAMCAPG